MLRAGRAGLIFITGRISRPSTQVTFKNSGKEFAEYQKETGAKWRAAKDGDVLEVDHTSLA